MSAIYVNESRYTQVSMMRPAHAGGDGATHDVVDMDVLRSYEDIQGEGEPDLIVELINLYLKDVTVKLASIQEAVAEGDAGSLSRAAHGLKGSSASIGAFHVAALCEELEHGSRVDLAEQAAALIEQLEQALEGTLRALEAERLRRS